MDEAKIPSFRLLPWASFCFRGRVAAVVSLASELYPLYDIGNSGRVVGGLGFLDNGEPKGVGGNLKTRKPGGGPKISCFWLIPWASVCFRGRVRFR